MRLVNYIEKGIKLLSRFPAFYFRFLEALVNFVNLEHSEQKKNLVQLLIVVYSILLGLSPHFLDVLKFSERAFSGMAISFLFIAILYYITIQKENSYNNTKERKYYLYLIFIFVISLFLSMTFSLFLTAFFLVGTTPESNLAAITTKTFIADYTLATFMMLAALMKKDKWTIALFYLSLVIFYFGFSYLMKAF